MIYKFKPHLMNIMVKVFNYYNITSDYYTDSYMN